MRRHTLKLILIIFTVTGLSGLTVRAQGPETSGLDVVFVIDQSGSMWGAGPGFTKNDKWGHRIGQAKNIIYRLAEHASETSFVHRVIVVDFGDEASLAARSPLIIKYDPKDPGRLLSETKAWTERYVTAKDLLNTNTPAGMELGLNELKKLEAAESLPNRRKVMLLLTDGRPDLGRGKESLEVLRKQIESVTAKLNENNLELWLVALNDSSNYWIEGDSEFWERVAGKNRARLAETASTNIATVIQDIVDDWLGVTSAAADKEYDCPPYLRRIIFNINFSAPRSPVTITDPEGNSVPLSSGGSASSPGTFSRFIVDGPQPGIYKINHDPSRGYTSGVELFSPDIQRIKPAKKTSIAVESQLLFQVRDRAGNPLQLLPEYPIKPSVLVTQPGGTQTEIPASYIDDGKFEAAWKPPAVGKYQLRLKGIVTLKNGNEIDVFGSNALTYDEDLEADDSRPYWLQITGSASAGMSIFPWQDMADFELTLLDHKKEKVASPQDVVKNPETWLAVQVVDKSGIPIGKPAPLNLTPNGTFVASLPMSLQWKNGEGWLRSGRLDLQVVAQPDRLPEKTYLDSVELPSSYQQRINNDSLTVGNISVHYSWLFLGFLLLIVLVVLLAGAAFVFRRVLPGAVVRWIDSSRRRTVDLKIYDGNDDPNGDFAKKFPLTSRGYFKADRMISLQINGTEVVASKFRITRDLIPDVVSVQINYSWNVKPEESYKIRLVKGRPQRLKGLPEGGDYLIALDVKSST